MQVPVAASSFNTHHLGRVAMPTRTPPHKQPHLECRLWPEIAERARHESLRNVAAEYGVSHETIRTILRRLTALGQAGCAA
ncbi:MAG: transposase family protein [Chloroflexota bacterium]|nr:transposase family protein [Chloroflexota bacterium]